VRRAMVFASSHDGFLPLDATGYQMRRDTRCDGIPDATGYQMRRDTRCDGIPDATGFTQ
jgi:hypothetical protein